MPAFDGVDRCLIFIVAEAGLQVSTQDRHLANHLLHPQRCEPVMLLGQLGQHFYHLRQCLDRAIRVVSEKGADPAA
ncbi:hypothetical protein D3C75_1188340 [compost metagenome]